MHGLGNWQDIAEFIGSKTKEECEQHYMDIYVNSETWPLPVIFLFNSFHKESFVEYLSYCDNRVLYKKIFFRNKFGGQSNNFYIFNIEKLVLINQEIEHLELKRNYFESFFKKNIIQDMDVKFKLDDETMRERKRRRVLTIENRPQSINEFIYIKSNLSIVT